MLVDPVTVAAASPTPSLVFAITKNDGYGTERVDTGGNGYTMVTNHSYQKGGGDKHYVQLTHSLVAENPISGANSKQTASISLTIVRPAFGFDDTAMVALVTALRDYVYDSQVTPAKLLQFQS
jgi:hypothetical protein